MKRLVSFAAIAAALALLPASHSLLAQRPEKVTICHIDDDPVEGAGHFISVAAPAVDAHLAHGDCLEADAIEQDFEEGTDDCSCEELTTEE